MIKSRYTLHGDPLVTRYEVLRIEGRPEIVIDRVLQEDGSHKWAIRSMSRSCLSTDGEWEYESMPSNRPEDWIATHRFDDFEVARNKAKVAALVTIDEYNMRVRLANEHEAKRSEDAGS